MLISDFFVIRDEFLRHVRSKLKGVKYDHKIATFKANSETFFKDFRRTNVLNEIGKAELVNVTLIELKKMQLDIQKTVDFHLDQIRLSNQSGDTPKQKNKFNAEQQVRIDYVSNKYTPKFPSRDQNTFSTTSFDKNDLFLGFKRPCEADPTVTVTRIADAVFVRLKAEQTEIDRKKFVNKDRKIVYEM